jgi:ferredoxin--NADP+ reductase
MNQIVEKALRGVALLRVRNIRHWTDRTFSFNCERPQSFRFRSGEFAMIGLIVDGKPLLRAYSICSPSWDDELEFYSIKVQDGPLTSRLQHLAEGDHIVMRPKPVGTLVHDALLPGRRLFLFSTGTGIAPFASIIRDENKNHRLPDSRLFQIYHSAAFHNLCPKVRALKFLAL